MVEERGFIVFPLDPPIITDFSILKIDADCHIMIEMQIRRFFG